jgi:hypothetical protein
MSYRKITVEGTEYQYTIGKTFVKLRGVGVFPKDKIFGLAGDYGYNSNTDSFRCDMGSAYGITPADIRQLILSNCKN